MRAELVGISLAVEAGRGRATSRSAHRYPGAPDQLDARRGARTRSRRGSTSSAPKVGQHLKYDAHVFANHGIALGGVAHDTMLESYVLNSTATRHDLDSLAARYLGLETLKYEDVVGKGAKQITFDQVDLDDARRATRPRTPTSRCACTRRCGRKLARDAAARARLPRHRDARWCACCSRWSAPACWSTPRLLRAAEPGARDDDGRDRAGRVRRWPAGRSTWARRSSSGDPLRPAAAAGARQDAERPAVDGGGRARAARRALTRCRGCARVPRPREAQVDVHGQAAAEIDPRTGRIHTSYHQAVAATGRLSSSDPNLQNIPIRTAEGRRIRQAFVAPPGFKLLAADYSQIELRIMAHLSGDEGLLAAFASEQRHPSRDRGRGLRRAARGGHRRSAPRRRRRSTSASSTACRRSGSPSSSASSGARRRTTSTATSSAIRACGATWTRRAQARARRGYVETVFGRRLYLPEINSRNAQLRQYAERSAINAPMQGTAADIIKRAMIEVAAWLAAEEPRRALDHAGARRARLRSSRAASERYRRQHRSHHGRQPRSFACRCASIGASGQLGRGALIFWEEAAGTFVKRRGTNPTAPRKGAPAILPNAGSLIPAHPAGVDAPGASPESRARGFFFSALPKARPRSRSAPRARHRPSAPRIW